MNNFEKLKNTLESFSPQNPKSVIESTLEENENVMIWNLNQACTFNCIYCKPPLLEHNDCGKSSPVEIASLFENTNKKWFLILSGGEPFLYPNFLELTKELTKKQYLLINTNLTTKNVFDFADSINPEKIIGIHTAIHILEREKNKEGLKNYLEKILYLQNKGFNIFLSYVAYPSLLQRMEKDFDFFKSNGINRITSKYFFGEYQGKNYPAAYTEEEKNLIQKYLSEDVDLDTNLNYSSFLGQYCDAGRKYIFMDISGNLFRCTSLIKKSYGNFFENKMKMDLQAQICTAKKCICSFEGILSSKNIHAGFFEKFKLHFQ